MHPGVTLRQIEAFYWVCRLGSFSLAAARLNATQPGISGRIRALEDALRTTLFDRSGRAVALTPAGRNLLETAERFMELGEELLARTRYDEGVRGVLRFGAADTIALTWLPELISNISRRFPLLEVELVVDLSYHLHEKLVQGEIDVAFSVGGPPRPDFEAFFLGEVENAWMCSPQLGLTDRPVTAAEIAAHPVLTHSRGSHLHQTVKSWFEGTGARPARLHSCNSLTTMIELSAAGLGIAVISPALVQPHLAAGRLAMITGVPEVAPNRFSLITSSGPLSRVLQATLELARDAAERSPGFMTAA